MLRFEHCNTRWIQGTWWRILHTGIVHDCANYSPQQTWNHVLTCDSCVHCSHVMLQHNYWVSGYCLHWLSRTGGISGINGPIEREERSLFTLRALSSFSVGTMPSYKGTWAASRRLGYQWYFLPFTFSMKPWLLCSNLRLVLTWQVEVVEVEGLGPKLNEHTVGWLHLVCVPASHLSMY